jgi:hypothetical protein
MDSGEQLGQINVSGGKVYSVAVTEDERHMMVGSASAVIDVFPVRDGTVSQPVYCFAGHRAAVSALAIAPSHQWVASGSWDRCAHVHR